MARGGQVGYREGGFESPPPLLLLTLPSLSLLLLSPLLIALPTFLHLANTSVFFWT